MSSDSKPCISFQSFLGLELFRAVGVGVELLPACSPVFSKGVAKTMGVPMKLAFDKAGLSRRAKGLRTRFACETRR
jgi:hypothetical protein